MNENIIRIAVVQMTTKTLEKERNISKTIKFLGQAVREGAKLVILPELCTSGNELRDIEEAKSVSEPIPNGITTAKWIEFAKENDIYIVGGVCEKSHDSLYNSAVFIGPDGYEGTYRKIHLWDDEKNLFVPGNQFKLYDTSLAKIGVMICYDGFFPETVRILTELGAEIICQPTAEKQIFDIEMNRARSYENAIFIATANLVGREGAIHYAGHSQITNPRGEIIACELEEKESVLITDIDVSEATARKQITKLNNILEDRRTDLYSRFLGYTPPQE